MNQRIKDKIEEIENYLYELSEIKPANFEGYKKDLKAKAACERYFEKIIEAVVDLAFLIIKEELANKLKEAKGMRNILAHEYGTVDDEIVFNSITKELDKDAKEFVKQIKWKTK